MVNISYDTGFISDIRSTKGDGINNPSVYILKVDIANEGTFTCLVDPLELYDLKVSLEKDTEMPTDDDHPIACMNMKVPAKGKIHPLDGGGSIVFAMDEYQLRINVYYKGQLVRRYTTSSELEYLRALNHFVLGGEPTID